MQFFDTHIHLADFENTTPDALMKSLKQTGIQKCICVCSRPDDFEKVAAFARSYPATVVPAFGLHPWYVGELSEGFEKELERYLKMFDVAPIGECGFDRLKNPDFEPQKHIFELQLALAKTYHRPLLLHAVKADLLFEKYLPLLPQKSVFHSYSGSVEFLKQVMKYELYISVNKRFFRKSDAQKIILQTPIERLVVETDAPFQSKLEELQDVVLQIANLKQMSVEKTAEILYANAEEILCYG
ncbi:MAG: TatD family hydrolase [Alphaproteobacteria bacterium]|nr:TatD family hydrolase [Alphaproteobacteria bacterium]